MNSKKEDTNILIYIHRRLSNSNVILGDKYALENKLCKEMCNTIQKADEKYIKIQ